MNIESIRSPDGKLSVTREYIGSVRFGPDLHRARFDGFESPFGSEAVFGDIEWTPDGLHLVLVVFHATRSDQAPDSELVLVAVGESPAGVKSLVREAKVIELLKVDNGEVLALVGNQRRVIAY